MTFSTIRSQITFLKSADKFNQLPDDNGIEIAFCGRSNAGKSSALNTLVGQKQLARVSKTPGRTQLINLFTVDAHRRLVDLPGYGYAKVPVKMRDHWDKLLSNYFYERQSLRALVLLMDCRHPLTDLDKQFMLLASDCNLRTHVLLTKADKLNFGPAKAQLQKLYQAFNQMPNGELFTAQLFSSLKRTGVDEAYDVLDELLAFDIDFGESPSVEDDSGE